MHGSAITTAPLGIRHNILLALIASAVGLFIAVTSLEIVLLTVILFTFTLVAILTPLTTLFFLLVLSPLQILIATEFPIQLPANIGQIGFALYLAALAVHRILNRRQALHLVWSPLYTLLIIFIMGFGLSVFSATSLGAWLTECLKWPAMLILTIICVNTSYNRLWQWLVTGLVLSGVANALVGIYIFFGGSGAEHLLINNRFYRAFGTFGQPNPFGGFLGLLLPLALMGALGYLHRWWRSYRNKLQPTNWLSLGIAGFYSSAAVIMLIGLLFSWSRGAWLGFVVSLGVIALALPRKTRHRILLIVTIALSIGGLWFSGLLPQSIVDRIANSTEDFFAFQDMRGVDITPDNYAVAERLAHWQAAFNMAEYNPWLGVGAGNYEIVYDAYRLMNWDEPLGHAHNYYLNILAEAGIIGLLCYATLWIGVVWITWRARQNPNPLARYTAIGLLGTWVYLATHSLLDNLYVNNVFIHIGILFGTLAILNHQTWTNIRLYRQ